MSLEIEKTSLFYKDLEKDFCHGRHQSVFLEYMVEQKNFGKHTFHLHTKCVTNE